MFQANLWCYLWDLVDEGVENVLDRVKGEAGVTGVSVAVGCPTVVQLRPHRGVEPRVFRSEGGVQFQPNRQGYDATRIRPAVATWLRKSNPLESLAEACAQRGLVLRGWLVCCHSPFTAGRFDFCAVKNVFGDVNPDWLCPANPDVREYLRALVRDLSEQYGFEALEMDSAAFPPAGTTDTCQQVCPELGPVGGWLLGLCFCESCRQMATRDGVDAAAAVRSASVLLEKALASGEPVPGQVEDLLARDLALATYAQWRCRQVQELLGMLREACTCRLLLHRKGNSLSTGSDFRLLASHCDGLITAPAQPNTDDVESGIGAAAEEAGDVSRVEVGVSACSPHCGDSAMLVRAFSRAAAMGVQSFSVANYGLLPLARLGWIKQAVRYAQREAQ